MSWRDKEGRPNASFFWQIILKALIWLLAVIYTIKYGGGLQPAIGIRKTESFR
jgi:hypothetical protein